MVDTINKNQYLINTNLEIIFQSYKTVIFTYYKHSKKIVFNTNKEKYTKTTCKYLGIALEKIDDLTGLKYNNLHYLVCYSKNRKQDILNLQDGILNLC